MSAVISILRQIDIDIRLLVTWHGKLFSYDIGGLLGSFYSGLYINCNKMKMRNVASDTIFYVFIYFK